MKKNILFVSVPFSGHFNVLYQAASEFARHHDDYDVHFVVCGWANVRKTPEESKQEQCQVAWTELTCPYDLTSTHPMHFTLPRVAALTPKLLEHCRAIPGGLDWIVFDFFAIEGHVVGQVLRVPRICSIPAIVSRQCPIGPDKLASYMKLPENVASLECLDRLYQWQGNVSITRAISDGFFVSDSERNWIWSPSMISPMPSTTIKNAQYKTLVVGKQDKKEENRRVVYTCLGTVVTDNLWNHNTRVRTYVMHVYEQVIAQFSKWRLKEKDRDSYQLVISIPGSKPGSGDAYSCLLQQHPEFSPTPKWLEIVRHVDQPALLASGRVALFITHGGGNSVTEAFWSQVPMLVIPFFGDQHSAAEQVETLGIGQSLTHLDPADAWNASSPTVDYSRRTTDISLDLFERLLSETCQDLIKTRFSQVCATSRTQVTDVQDGLQDLCVVWKRGDLLYGTNADRKLWIASSQLAKAGLDKEAFKLGNCVPFPEYARVDQGQVPCFIDQFHDTLLSPTYKPSHDEQDSKIGFGRELKNYGAFLRKQRPSYFSTTPPLFENEKEERLWDMCCLGLEYTLDHHNDRQIHFVLGRGFVWARNRATTLELQWLRQHFWRIGHRICAYRQVDEKNLVRVRLPDQLWMDPHQVVRTIAEQTKSILPGLLSTLQTYHAKHCMKHYPAEFQHRVKTENSLHEKLFVRNVVKVLDDVLGFRFIHPWTANLFKIARDLGQLPNFGIFRQVAREQGKVIYLYGRVQDTIFEIQLWPTILYTCFAYEHDLVYKPDPSTQPRQVEIQSHAARVRKEEHALQDAIDAHVLIPYL